MTRKVTSADPTEEERARKRALNRQRVALHRARMRKRSEALAAILQVNTLEEARALAQEALGYDPPGRQEHTG